ncbi:MAG: GDSL family lipase, partial [Oscillospiraceae bacterium]|nr:GDSL family lipase [Oscillospiraceae bacterium]
MQTFLADDKHVRTVGRSIFHNNIRYLSWSCSAVEFVCTGTEITAEIWTDWIMDEPWKEIFRPYIAVFANDEAVPRKRFAINEGTAVYTIYKSETAETVKICIMKLSEAAFSKIGIVGISADGEIAPTSPLPRRMEFIGDSITCGFGIEGKSAEEHFSTATENPYINYASKAARSFGAECNLISWSGIGVYSSDTKTDEINDSWLMPMLYDYTDLAVEGHIGIENHAEWDFSGFAPDVIVINLGTNDNFYTKGIPERVEGFKLAYEKFVRHIREKNPNSHIVCALGMMGAELYPAIEEAVKKLGDDKVYALEFDIQRDEDGIGSEQHPNYVTHNKAAVKLSGKISEITGW